MPYIGGNYSGLQFITFNVGVNGRSEEIEDADDLLDIFTTYGAEDRVVSIFTMPKDFAKLNSPSGEVSPDPEDPVIFDKIIPIKTDIDGYKPHNNKLFTYPYNYLTVDSTTNSEDYRWERFNTYPTVKFAMACAMSCSPEIVCYPENYDGSNHANGGYYATNATNAVSIDGFPQSAYIIDGFRAWLAGTRYGIFGYERTPKLGEALHAYRRKGEQTSNTNVSLRNLGFYFKYMCVNKEQARIIDNYFDRYGYACKKVKVPNRNVRKNWTYTQTQDVAIIGDIPNEAMNKIKDIYNNGITFWNKDSLVGDYSQSNQVLGGD